MSQSNQHLLLLKQASINMAKASGYNVEEDLPVMDYKPSDIKAYYEYAESNAESNAIRKALIVGNQLTKRSALSTLYESNDRPNHYILFCFIPLPENSKNAGKDVVIIPANLCKSYTPMKQQYCSSCIEEFNTYKRCLKCPQQHYCEECTESLKCENCLENKFCTACTAKLKKINVYKLAREKCPNCTDKDFCKLCNEMRKNAECKECTNTKKQSDKDACSNCLSKLQCKDCPEVMPETKKGKKSKTGFCEDCDIKINFERCEKCPPVIFCSECTRKYDIKPCKKCPPSPQIIERCVIISELQLTPEAKQVVSGNIPRIRASTGEWIETGTLFQIFLDHDILYNPLIHSLGSNYQVMSTEETVEFFQNKDNHVTENQIFQLDMSLPISKYLGLFPGKLVRVERPILVPGSILTYEITYRLVRIIPIVKKNRRLVKKKINTNVSGAVEDEYI